MRRKNVKKYFVVSDVHGFYDIFIDSLNKSGFDITNRNHILISCGGLIDRGTQSYQILEFVNNLSKERRILIKGNHEELFEDLVYRGYPKDIDHKNGTFYTWEEFKKILNFNNYREYENTFIAKLFEEFLDYYETKKYIFTHGYIPTYFGNDGHEYYKNWRNASSDEWYNARWLDGISLNIKGVYEKNKTIVVGHKHSINGNIRKFYPGKSISQLSDKEYFSKELNQIYYEEGIICLDANTFRTKIVNVLVLNEDEL